MTELRKELESGTIGDVLSLYVNFGFRGLHIPRIKQKDHAGGAVYDIGCYPLLFSDFVFKEKPKKMVTAGCLLEPEGVCNFHSDTNLHIKMSPILCAAQSSGVLTFCFHRCGCMLNNGH